uniref:Uncharacterized protein n=1 Tax=Anguilla anguilla TaxID=7936 RepID=A0A0E9RX25_ANGAN
MSLSVGGNRSTGINPNEHGENM